MSAALTFGDAEAVPTLADDVGDIERRAGSAIDNIGAHRRQWAREHRRPPALSAREALAALQFEALLVWTTAHNIAHGMELSADDLDRLNITCRRIDTISDEVLR